jgi:hypothetical protein
VVTNRDITNVPAMPEVERIGKWALIVRYIVLIESLVDGCDQLIEDALLSGTRLGGQTDF